MYVCTQHVTHDQNINYLLMAHRATVQHCW